MKVHTESGSIYELDLGAKLLRRLNDELGSSTRVGAGEWRPFQDLSPVEVGEPLLIVWRYDEKSARLQTTLTSTITSYEL